MESSISISNPFLWISLLSALSALSLYLIARRKFGLLYRKPKIEIIQISTKKPERNEWERIENCFIKINIFNLSSFGNHVSMKIKKSRFTKTIKSSSRIYSPNTEYENFFELPPFKKILFEIIPEYKEIEKYIGKKMLLIIIDNRKNKTRKKFIFSDLNL